VRRRNILRKSLLTMDSTRAHNAHKMNILWRYLLAPAATAAALLLRLMFQRQLGDEVPYITFFPAVMIAAGLGGFGPGLLSVALSSLAACFLEIPPYFRPRPGNSWVTGLRAAVD
jgi:K+-sensing histidine kinase KdpD